MTDYPACVMHITFGEKSYPNMTNNRQVLITAGFPFRRPVRGQKYEQINVVPLINQYQVGG